MEEEPKYELLSPGTREALAQKRTATPEQIKELEEHLNLTRDLMEKMSLNAADLGRDPNDPKMNVTLKKKP